MGKPRIYDRPIVTCRRCGKQYECNMRATMGVYCSHACRFNQVEKQCVRCGKTFSVRASKVGDYQICSLECKRATSTSVDITCATCGKVFTVPHSRASARYCSNACSSAKGRVTIQCAYCGKDRVMKKYRVARENARFCGNRCSILYRITHDMPSGYIAEKLRSGRRTDIEAAVERVLIDIQLPYLFEHKVSRYLVDFALPTIGVALECDGWHHATDKGIEHDAIKDVVLLREGWHVIRLNEHAIRKDAHALVLEALSSFDLGSNARDYPLQLAFDF